MGNFLSCMIFYLQKLYYEMCFQIKLFQEYYDPHYIFLLTINIYFHNMALLVDTVMSSLYNICSTNYTSKHILPGFIT